MRELKRLDKYVITPNIAFYGGYIHDGEDIKLCEDHDMDDGYDLKVKQTIENDVLITDLKREYTRKNGKTIKEKSHQEVEIEKGQLLIYVEGVGFTIPEYKMCKTDEAIRLYEILEGKNEADRDEKESFETDRRSEQQ